MKLLFITLFCLSGAGTLMGQTQCVLVDDETLEPVPYANIWFEHSEIGTNSDTNGTFRFRKNYRYTTLVISALGYHQKTLLVTEVRDTIRLSPKPLALNEVVVYQNLQKGRKRTVIGRIEHGKVGHYLPGFSTPYTKMYARYFAFKEDYRKTPYLKKIRIKTESDREAAPFKILLMEKAADGSPGAYLYNKNIIVEAKSGRRITEIDLEPLHLKLPETGIFIAVEWLHLKQNLASFSSFKPSIGFMQKETNTDSWYFKNGEWQPVERNGGEYKHYMNKYNVLAAELVLSN